MRMLVVLLILRVVSPRFQVRQKEHLMLHLEVSRDPQHHIRYVRHLSTKVRH